MESNKKYSTKTEETKIQDNFMSELNDDIINGCLIRNKYIPEELLAEIFKRIDNKTLLLCHLVCKQWHKLLKEYVWRKKAEYVNGKKFPVDDKVPWTSYYYLCDNRPFGKNLLYNKVAPYKNKKTITMIEFGKGEDIPVNITPFPDDNSFQGKCIITNTEHKHHNRYVIDLLEEGFTAHILDKLQPIVKVCEWYGSETQHGLYNCSYKLVKLTHYDTDEECDMRVFHYEKSIKKVGQWIKFTHSFKNYGEGLRKIKFYHGASNGVVIVGASVTLEINMYHNISNRKIRAFTDAY